MAKSTKTLDEIEQADRDRFNALQAELDAHDDAGAPLRTKMDAILARIAELDKEMAPLADEWRGHKDKRAELANRLARTARTLPGNRSTSDAA